MIKHQNCANHQIKPFQKLITKASWLSGCFYYCSHEGKHHQNSARCSLFLLENDSIDRNKDTNAESCENTKRHLQLLMFHPVQVVHMLSMKVIWFVMAMRMASPHPLNSSRMKPSIGCQKHNKNSSVECNTKKRSSNIKDNSIKAKFLNSSFQHLRILEYAQKKKKQRQTKMQLGENHHRALGIVPILLNCRCHLGYDYSFQIWYGLTNNKGEVFANKETWFNAF